MLVDNSRRFDLAFQKAVDCVHSCPHESMSDMHPQKDFKRSYQRIHIPYC